MLEGNGEVEEVRLTRKPTNFETRKWQILNKKIFIVIKTPLYSNQERGKSLSLNFYQRQTGISSL